MQNSLAFLLSFIIGGGGIATLLYCFVGIVVVLAIVFFIMRTVGAPDIAYKILYVVGAIIVLILAIDFFFGGGGISTGGGSIRIRD